MGFVKLSDEQIKEDPQQQLKKFKRTKDFLVAIDTDGCVTDNMNGKQMLIFHPQYMEFYQLWEIESYFREIAEYYNLFSVDRGCNRFIAIQLTLKTLAERQDVKDLMGKKHVQLPDVAVLDKYIAYCEENSLGLGNPSLEQYLNTVPVNFAVHKLLSWSEAVNRTFPFINPKIPPFNNVKESLQLIMDSADVFVVSQTPYEDLINYWETQNLTEYVQMIAGQEMGKKSHHIEIVKEVGGYRDDHVLMLGDGGGDLKAIKHNNGLFYPVPAGQEDNAWSKFPEVFELFLKESYAGDPEKQLLDNFSKALLTTPAWETSTYNHLESYREKQETRKALYARLNPQGQLLVL